MHSKWWGKHLCQTNFVYFCFTFFYAWQCFCSIMRVMLFNADAIFQICPDLASLDDKYEHQAWSAAPGKGNRLMSLMPWGKLRGTEDTDEALSLSTTFLLMLLLPLSIPMFSPSLLFTFWWKGYNTRFSSWILVGSFFYEPPFPTTPLLLSLTLEQRPH